MRGFRAFVAVAALTICSCAPTGSVRRVQATPPAPAPSDSMFVAYAGAFRTNDGDTWGVNGHGNLANFANGWFRQLFPTARPGHFTVGPGFQVALPKVADVVFSPVSGTQVMTIHPVEGAPIVAHRLRFTTSEVHIPSSGAVLAATITEPASPGSHPGIVIVHGSGVGLRIDYGIWVALYASLGFAVLAYDKRGNGESTGNYPGDYASDAALTVLADDAATCLRFLARWPGVDSAAVGFHGGSQGGWVVPLAIERDAKAAFAVLLSAPAVSVGRQGTWADFSGGSQYLPTESAAQMDALVRAQNSGYDPAPVLSRMVIPILWINGAVDRQVPTSLNAEILESLHKPNFDIHVLAGVGHSLLLDRTGLAKDDITAPGLASDVFALIATWLARYSALPSSFRASYR